MRSQTGGTRNIEIKTEVLEFWKIKVSKKESQIIYRLICHVDTQEFLANINIKFAGKCQKYSDFKIHVWYTNKYRHGETYYETTHVQTWTLRFRTRHN